MKTMLLFVGLLLLVAAAVAARAADDKTPAADGDARPAASADHPTPCVPAQKDPHRREEFLKDKEARLKKGPIKLVFIGDSITDAWRGGGAEQALQRAVGQVQPAQPGHQRRQDRARPVAPRARRTRRPRRDGQGRRDHDRHQQPRQPAPATPEDTAKGVEVRREVGPQKAARGQGPAAGRLPPRNGGGRPVPGQIKTINDTIAKLTTASTCTTWTSARSFWRTTARCRRDHARRSAPQCQGVPDLGGRD